MQVSEGVCPLLTKIMTPHQYLTAVSPHQQYFQQLSLWSDGTPIWITLEILSTKDRTVFYRPIGSNIDGGIPALKQQLLDSGYQVVPLGEIPKQFLVHPFDNWLTENYELAGLDAHSKERWFLSNRPNEYLPISESQLKKQYFLEYRP